MSDGSISVDLGGNLEGIWVESEDGGGAPNMCSKKLPVVKTTLPAAGEENFGSVVPIILFSIIFVTVSCESAQWNRVHYCYS